MVLKTIKKTIKKHIMPFLKEQLKTPKVEDIYKIYSHWILINGLTKKYLKGF
jgi:hypothetical protein